MKLTFDVIGGDKLNEEVTKFIGTIEGAEYRLEENSAKVGDKILSVTYNAGVNLTKIVELATLLQLAHDRVILYSSDELDRVLIEYVLEEGKQE